MTKQITRQQLWADYNISFEFTRYVNGDDPVFTNQAVKARHKVTGVVYDLDGFDPIFTVDTGYGDVLAAITFKDDKAMVDWINYLTGLGRGAYGAINGEYDTMQHAQVFTIP